MLGSKLLRKTSKINLRHLVKVPGTQKYYGYGDRLKIPFEKGPLSKDQIKTLIKTDRTFCGDETSISRSDLSSYLNNNTVIYSYKNGLSGVMTVGKKSGGLYIYGICVPPKHKGVGKKLMNIAKDIARDNGLPKIRLECYGSVHLFYKKQGYTIIEENEIENSNNSNVEITKYVMEYVIGSRTSGSPRTPRTPRNSRAASGSPRTSRAAESPRTSRTSRSPRTTGSIYNPIVKNLNN